MHHGVYIAEDFSCSNVRGITSELASGFSSQQSAWTNFESFDLRRRDRLGSEEQAGEGFGIDETWRPRH